MGWLPTIFGKEELKTAPFTANDLKAVSDALIKFGKEVDPLEHTVFDDITQHFTNLRAEFAKYADAISQYDELSKERSELFEKARQSPQKINAQTSKKLDKLVADKAKAKRAVQVKLTTISMELNIKEERYKPLISRLREILEPVFVKLGNEVELPQYTINSAVPKKGWFS